MKVGSLMKLKCPYCNHTWNSRGEGLPARCPKCNRVLTPFYTDPTSTPIMEEQNMNINEQLDQMEATLKAGLKGTIVSVEETSSARFYGSKEFGDRKGIAVVVELNEKVPEKEFEVKEFFGIPEMGGYYKSNIYAFKKRYGQAPKENMVVDLRMSENGFWEINY